MSDHESTEARLRAALQAKADAVTDASLARADAPEPGGATVYDLHRARRRLRRSLPLLAAVAAVIVAAGTAATVTSLQSDKPPATRLPTAPSTQSPTTAGTAPVVPAPGTTASTPGTATGASTTPPTHRVVVEGVGLTVPARWKPATRAADGSRLSVGCLTVDGVPQTRRGTTETIVNDNCELTVSTVKTVSGQAAQVNPDIPFVTGQGAPCGSGPDPTGKRFLRTDDAGNDTVGGEQGEYRSFSANCISGRLEQWTAMTAPGVVFTRFATSSADHDAARRAVQGATLPGPRGTLRLNDLGRVCSVNTAAGGTRVEIDRVTQVFGQNSDYTNANPKTYGYTAGSAVRVLVTDDQARQTELQAKDLGPIWNGGTVNGVTRTDLANGLWTVETDGTAVTQLVVQATGRAVVSGCGG